MRIENGVDGFGYDVQCFVVCTLESKNLSIVRERAKLGFLQGHQSIDVGTECEHQSKIAK
jgi:hypothetical protein